MDASQRRISPSPFLVDPQGRRLDYLRFAITDRCNLRCRYCMPESGIDLASHDDILTFEESARLCDVFCGLGVRKIRITGGEPLVRWGAVDFISQLSECGRPEVLLTTNGVLLADHLADLMAAGIQRINLSLDSLDPANWQRIARRPGFNDVMRAVDAVLYHGLGLKINVVVMAEVNDHEMVDFVELTKDRPIEVRFIESMSFDGSGDCPGGHIAGSELQARLEEQYTLNPVTATASGVARQFAIPGYAGKIGIIEGHTRSFCGSCNRLRLDARGRMRTCLYGTPKADLGEMIRSGASDADLANAIRSAVAGRYRDGHRVEQDTAGRHLLSMASIGG